MSNRNIAHQLELETGNKEFPVDYKHTVFSVWFDAGKPGASKLLRIIQPVTGTTILPSLHMLNDWIQGSFIDMAEELDREIVQRLKEDTIASKVEMLERHITIGREMQEIALKWLRDHKDELNPNAAARLIVDGIKLEQESEGIPDALKRLASMSNEDLIDELGKMIADSPGRIEANV